MSSRWPEPPGGHPGAYPEQEDPGDSLILCHCGILGSRAAGTQAPHLSLAVLAWDYVEPEGGVLLLCAT